MVIVDKLVQPRKLELPIVIKLILFVNVTVDKLVQLEKQLSPIVVTKVPKTTLVKTLVLS